MSFTSKLQVCCGETHAEADVLLLSSLIFINSPQCVSVFILPTEHFPATYGHEYLLLQVKQKIGCKVHVTDWQWQQYEGVTEILDAVTCDPNETRVHACIIPGVS